MKKYTITFLFFLVCGLIHSQTSVSGLVLDAKSKEFIPFTNIGIKNKNVGTISSDKGFFTLIIPSQFENDTLTFSMVGYYELKIPVQSLRNTKQNTFLLKPKANVLTEVVVSGKQFKEKKFGIKKNGRLIHFIDASINQNDIFEIAQLLHLPKQKTKILSVNLHVNEPSTDSVAFRINFYSCDGDFPSKKIIEKNLIQKQKLKEGWLNIDLSKQDIYLKGEVAVAIEFFPGKNQNIKYEVKLGGKSKSFVRSNSLGTWATPPHHYCLYVTALTDTESVAEDESDNKESVPDYKLFSQNVKDSFFVFVNLPKGYNPLGSKKYKTVYLLDANAFFDIMAYYNHKEKQEAILVGIGYKNAYFLDSLRQRDYTFPKAQKFDSLSVSGGANEFKAFITKELIPLIDKTYRTDSINRILMGHSLGGYFPLFVLHQQLINHQKDFSCFISASPSLEYANDYMLEQFKNEIEFENGFKLYISIGEKEMMKQFEQFVELLQKNHKKLQVQKEVFPRLDHMGAAIPGFKSGMKALKD